MAKKEFTKGDVINIFGRVIGKGIEFSGCALLILSKGIARAARGTFWIVGKHVDMIEAVKDMKKKGFIDTREVPLIERSPKKRNSSNAIKKQKPSNAENPDDLNEIIDKLASVKQALNYSQSVFENGILPKEEILKVDNQAFIMARAIRNIVERAEYTQLKKEAIKVSDTFLKISIRFLKYHSIKDELQAGKTKEMLAEACEIMSHLVRNRQDIEGIEKNANNK